MNSLNTMQIIGIILLLLIFGLELWVAINPLSTKRSLRSSIFWFSVWVFFYLVIRVLAYFNIATRDQLIYMSTIALFIPLSAIVVNLILDYKLENNLRKKMHRRKRGDIYEL